MILVFLTLCFSPTPLFTPPSLFVSSVFSSVYFSPPSSPPTPHFVHLSFIHNFLLSPLQSPSLGILHFHLLFSLQSFRTSFFSTSTSPLACTLPSPASLFLYYPILHLPPFFLYVSSAAPQLSGHPLPPRLPTTSAALPRPTAPTSTEGWASAAHSTQDSSGAPGTSRALPTPAGPRPRHCHMATARPGGHTAPPGFSASSHPSLYAGE